MACQHYSNNNLLIFECCKKAYPCRLCHDMNEIHRSNRYEISKMQCILCNTKQQASQRCLACNTEVSRYYCNKCNLWDSSGDRIFHCEECKVCRRGNAEDAFHCDACQTCLLINGSREHVHVENATGRNCPICAEGMHECTEVLVLLRCGHSMHESCLLDYMKKAYTCPICSKPMGNTSMVDAKIRCLVDSEAELFSGVAELCSIECGDCGNPSKAVRGIVYNRCPFCGSCNTIAMACREQQAA
ncbi:CHY zinc finger domain-containing protein [Ordospora pajunii]|jgi:RING finger/CHY zinc finger protein 1|uniref:CHY zinc finger domain-containing protein n=1 Tax=Ordospora pajunii TaxID=3039483 RepID=UPI00295271A2|nr:CHY zinc finger domain-containing protein [Ordospora pajunii]KAH9410556.1 CHY zinc finger domain-containing protein [Ordospora pajunii]